MTRCPKCGQTVCDVNSCSEWDTEEPKIGLLWDLSFYVASSLANRDHVSRMISHLRKHGGDVTFDWTVNGSKPGDDSSRMASIAQLEIRGVKESQVVIVIAPGGHGTHVEIGAALASGKRVIIYATGPSKEEALKSLEIPYLNVFYYHPLVRVFYGSIDELVQFIYEVQ